MSHKTHLDADRGRGRADAGRGDGLAQSRSDYDYDYDYDHVQVHVHVAKLVNSAAVVPPCDAARAVRVHYTGDMLDLKAKLASAGLVSKEDVERVEREKAKRASKSRSGGKGKGKSRSASGATGGPRLPVGKLQGKPKAEVYPAIRTWVEEVRLDPPSGTPSEAAQPFHFARLDGKIGRLVLEPKVIAALQSGAAGLITYMSNHGLGHAVVPSAGAKAVAELFPEWLRVLEGDTRAGRVVRSTGADRSDESESA